MWGVAARKPFANFVTMYYRVHAGLFLRVRVVPRGDATGHQTRQAGKP